MEDARQRGAIAGEEEETGGSLPSKKKRSSKRKKITTATPSALPVVKKVRPVISTPALLDVQVVNKHTQVVIE